MFDSFFIYGDVPPEAEKGVYQLPLVVLSYMVASFASYTALSLAQQMSDAVTDREKIFLHWGGAFAMGAGIWSMHFIGMLSYKMDMVVHYDPAFTLLSMVIAIAFSYCVLDIVARTRQLSLTTVLIAGALLGLGICSMHYTGMAAMRMDGDLRYTVDYFLLSVAIAITASSAALWMMFALAQSSSLYRYPLQVGAALIMGAAICGMHYAGMHASVFIPWANCRYDPHQDFTMLAISIAIITSIILGLALATGFYKRAQMEFRLQRSENRLRTMIEGAMDAVIGINQDGKITEWNKQAENIFGWTYFEAIGKPVNELTVPPGLQEAGMEQFLAGELGLVLNRRLEISAIDKNGRVFPAELSMTSQKLRDKNYYFAAFVRDITERKRTEQELADYTRELEESNRELDDFAYIASHDLKEPLRGLHNFSRFLLEDYEAKLDDEGKNMLQTISQLTQRMDGLLSALLHYSRLGRTALSVRPVDLNEIVKNAINIHYIKIQETGAEVKVDPLPTIVCDHVRISEVFQNLIGNALKYNDGKPVIEIGCREDHPDHPGEMVYFVKDNGIGIESKNIDSIFKIFRRLHTQSAYGGGTGSGLTITKKIITQHGGKIWVESEGKGRGATFFFTIPPD